MPGRDGTGPMRQGAMTGGGFGPCGAGGGRRSMRSEAWGRGGAYGHGWGRRNRQWLPEFPDREVSGAREPATSALSPDVEKTESRREVVALKGELERLKLRIAELEEG